MSASVKPTLRRADAQRNRDRIVKAASDLVRSGEELRLNAVAKAVGVGQGTLYRHFPTREDLLAEVYRSEVEDLVALAPTLADRDPLDGLTSWLERVTAYARVKRDVFAALEVATWQDLAAHSLGPIGDAVEGFLAAGRADGSVRPDVEARDVIILVSWLSRLDDAELDLRAGRLIDVVVSGLFLRR